MASKAALMVASPMPGWFSMDLAIYTALHMSVAPAEPERFLS